MGWIIVTLVVIVIFVVMLIIRRMTETTYTTSPAIRELPGAIPPRPLATEMLSLVRSLQAEGAQWDVLLSRLNPTGDGVIQQRLLTNRGPNLFNPNAGLGTIASGCEEAIKSNPKADAVSALDEAIKQLGIIIDR
jgi:hypothetical protein